MTVRGREMGSERHSERHSETVRLTQEDQDVEESASAQGGVRWERAQGLLWPITSPV